MAHLLDRAPPVVWDVLSPRKPFGLPHSQIYNCSFHSGREYFSAASRCVAAWGQSEQSSEAAQAACNAERSMAASTASWRRRHREAGPGDSPVAGRHGQATADHLQRKIIDERAMIQQMLALVSARCCRKPFSRRSPDRRYPGASGPGWMAARPRRSCRAPGLGPIDRSQWRPKPQAEHHGVHQAARPHDDGRPAADPPHDGHSQLAAHIAATSSATRDERPMAMAFSPGLPKP